MIVLVMKHNTEKKVPVGILCFHDHTFQLVCKGTSLLSTRMFNDYKTGFTFYIRDRFQKPKKIMYFGENFKEFKTHAPIYYSFAGFTTKECVVKDPDSSEIYLSYFLTIELTPSDHTIERIELTGVTNG